MSNAECGSKKSGSSLTSAGRRPAQRVRCSSFNIQHSTLSISPPHPLTPTCGSARNSPTTAAASRTRQATPGAARPSSRKSRCRRPRRRPPDTPGTRPGTRPTGSRTRRRDPARCPRLPPTPAEGPNVVVEGLESTALSRRVRSVTSTHPTVVIATARTSARDGGQRRETPRRGRTGRRAPPRTRSPSPKSRSTR